MKKQHYAASRAGKQNSPATDSPITPGAATASLYGPQSGEPWGRLPKPKGRLWGLSRTTILEMCERGEVKSTVIKKRGAVRGIRLIYMQSLAEALERLAAKQSRPAKAA